LEEPPALLTALTHAPSRHMPSPFSSPTTHSNISQHTLATIRHRDDESERASLLSRSSGASYGVAPPIDPLAPAQPSRKRIIFKAAVKMAAIFIVGCLLLGGTLYIAMPRLEECVTRRLSRAILCLTRLCYSVDREKLRIPKSFDQLQALNELLKKYRDIYPFRILICFVIMYLLCAHFLTSSHPQS
jgi:hypothetical protein